ncbi:SdpI family protein [Microbacterium karelineae]|uniref:SdpI family protein n=1 Tax=Microbacterium karelineae TaxID=2654283 RepID=UPI0012E9B337|nr:SdpI family protein [Microbacterium karelineae]
MNVAPQVAGLLIVGLVIFFVGRAASNGGIGRNSVIGIRTRWSRASDAAWKATHLAFKPYSVACALVAVAHAGALVVTAIVSGPALVSNLLTLSGYVVVLAILLVGLRAAKRVAEAN